MPRWSVVVTGACATAIVVLHQPLVLSQNYELRQEILTTSRAVNITRAASRAENEPPAPQVPDDPLNSVVTVTLFDKTYSGIATSWQQQLETLGLPNIFMVSLDVESEVLRRNSGLPGMPFACVRGNCSLTDHIKDAAAMWSAKADLVMWMMKHQNFSGVFFVEMDIFLQRNPFREDCGSRSLQHFAKAETDLWISQHLSLDSINFGLFLLKSNPRTWAFWEAFQQRWKLTASNGLAADQKILDHLLRQTPRTLLRVERLDPRYFALKEWRHWTFDLDGLRKGMTFYTGNAASLAGQGGLGADEVCSVHITSTGTRGKLFSLIAMFKQAKQVQSPSDFDCKEVGIKAEGVYSEACCDLNCAGNCGQAGCRGDQLLCCPSAIKMHGPVCSARFPTAPCVQKKLRAASIEV